MTKRLQAIHQNLKEFGNVISMENLKIAYKANMTHYEMKICHEISELRELNLEYVLTKMAHFKETSDYRLYKKDFVNSF